MKKSLIIIIIAVSVGFLNLKSLGGISAKKVEQSFEIAKSSKVIELNEPVDLAVGGIILKLITFTELAFFSQISRKFTL